MLQLVLIERFTDIVLSGVWEKELTDEEILEKFQTGASAIGWKVLRMDMPYDQAALRSFRLLLNSTSVPIHRIVNEAIVLALLSKK